MGFEVPQFEWNWISFGIWCFAGVWALIALMTWMPVRRKLRWLPRQLEVELPNREALIRAIASVQHAAIEVINQQDTLNQLKAQSPNIVYTELEMTADEAYATYTQAMKVLDQEQLVAGSAIKQLLNDLKVFISMQVFLKIGKPIQVGGDKPLLLTPLEFAAKLSSRVEGTIKEIDRISQQASHKG